MKNFLLKVIFLQVIGLAGANCIAAELVQSNQLTCQAVDVAKIEEARLALSKDFSQIFLDDLKKQRHTDCFLSARKAESLRVNNQATIVDIRRKSLFQQYRIRESVNLPVHVLKTKQFYKNQKIILVDDGSAYEHMEKACIDLRNDGFKQTYILSGGLNLWNSQNGSLFGDQVILQTLKEISAKEFFLEKNYNQFYVIDISATQSSKLAGIPVDNLISSSGSIGGIEQEINKISETSNAGTPITLVIADDNDQKYDALKKQIKGNNNVSIFFLKGGWSAYNKFVGEQIAIWKRVLQRPLDQMNCGA